MNGDFINRLRPHVQRVVLRWIDVVLEEARRALERRLR
jgi:hypothetical protein